MVIRRLDDSISECHIGDEWTGAGPPTCHERLCVTGCGRPVPLDDAADGTRTPDCAIIAPMRDLDLKTLRLYIAVCETGNMARAAEREHIEPSAISKRIAQLEADLGARLLQRARRGVQPTPAGVAVLEHARNVLFALERMASDIAGIGSGVQGYVRLLATASAIAEALPDDVAAFMRSAENRAIKVDVEERYSHDLVREIREGRASIGVCWDSADLAGLQQRPYRRDRLAVAVHREHPLARRRSLRFEATLDHPHVGLPPNAAIHTLLQRAAARHGRTVPYRAVVSNFEAAFRVVAANLAISIVPVEVGASTAARLGLKIVPLTDAWAYRQFVVCFVDEAALQPAARRLADCLAEQARTMARD